MQEVEVDFKGAFRRVNREQLLTIVEKGFVKPETRMRIDGRECQLRHIIAQVESNAERLVPDFSKSNESSSPFDEQPVEGSRVKSLLFNDDPFGSASSMDFKATKPSAPPPVEAPKSNRSLVIILCAVVGVLLLSVVILSIALSVGGGEKEKSEDAEAVASSAPVDAGPARFMAGREEPFDLSTDHIDPEYKGTSAIELFEGLEKFWKFEKDEFETTDAFKARVEKAVNSTSSRPVLGAITFSSPIAVPLENFEQEYNADQGKLTFKFKVLTNLKPKYRSSGTPTLEVYRSEKAWTKKVNVTKVRSRQVEGVTRTAYTLGARAPFAQEVVVDMSPDKARALKDNVKALVVFKLDYVQIDDSYTSIESGEYDGPGLDQYAVTEDFMLVKDLQFWVYDKTTGEVVLKRPLVQAQDETTK